MTWRQVDRDELLHHSARDPFVRFATSHELLAVAGPHGWACVSPWRPGSRHWGGAAVVEAGAPARAETDALAAIVDAAGDEVALEWFSTEDRRGLDLPEAYASTGSGRWSFLWCEEETCATVPAGLGELGLEVVELDDREDADLLHAFGRTHGEDPYMGFPGHGFASLWLAVRDEVGRMVAVGALHELGSGMPHLAGIVVRPQRRGQGIGAMLTEALTARAVEEAGVATLSVFSDNVGAIRLYERLGYATAHRFHTRELDPAAVTA
ncbi:GNAT family N-acetyltransferase [Serinicoccus kebangsaanensis]|uniref:GNAT family N-acetyltransferase n=1 Tax=Serinicoccus kebangsaanensis TaxID=2602069 RepID=UPI00124CD57B|nr:GNAT family N-acetyltransferase [Serinicoccus kebangsaanensis]